MRHGFLRSQSLLVTLRIPRRLRVFTRGYALIRTMVWLSILCAFSTTATARWYTIELLAFAYPEQSAAESVEYWPIDPEEPDWDTAAGDILGARAPASGVITSPYGVRRYYNGVFARNYFHRGLDYGAETGTPVVAPADGEVVLVGRVRISCNVLCCHAVENAQHAR